MFSLKQTKGFQTKAFALLFAAATLGMAGCSDDPKMDEGPDAQPEELMPSFYDEEDQLDVPVYISSMPSGHMGTVLSKRFTNRASIDDAPLCLFNDPDVASSLDAIDRAYKRGAVVAILNPSLQSTDLLQKMGHPISPASDPALLMAYDRTNEYEISGDGEFGLADDEEAEHGEEWEQYIAETFAGKDPHYETMSDNFDCFVEWANKEIGSSRKSRANSGQGPAMITKYLSKTADINHYIDKMIAGSSKDYLSGSWDCDVSYSVRPAYVYEVNDDAAGDYYSIEADVVLRNNRLWNSHYNKHGAFKTYMIGYYMRHFDIDFELLADNGGKLQNVRFYRYPFPEATVNTQSVTDGFSQGLNVSATPSFEAGGDGAKGGLSLTAGYSAQWSHSTSYSMPDVSVGVSTAGGKAHYTLTCNSAQNWPCNWDKRDTGSAYPALCHNEMHFNLHWIWKVPAGTNGVKDDAKTKFKIRTSGTLNYGVSHWFNQAGHSDHHQDWSDITFSDLSDIPSIDRARFGTIAITNNSQTYSMGNFKFYKAGTQELVSTIDQGVNYNQTARYNFYVGDYDMTYDLINGNTNKVVSSWRISNIKVRQGKGQEASTTYLTSTMGEKY